MSAQGTSAGASERGSAEGGSVTIAETLRTRLESLSPSVLTLDDDSAEHAGHAGAAGGGGHFSLLIVSEQFAGLTRVARHRAVLDRVGDLIPYPVHALAIRAYTPDEFPS